MDRLIPKINDSTHSYFLVQVCLFNLNQDIHKSNSTDDLLIPPNYTLRPQALLPVSTSINKLSMNITVNFSVVNYSDLSLLVSMSFFLQSSLSVPLILLPGFGFWI